MLSITQEREAFEAIASRKVVTAVVPITGHGISQGDRIEVRRKGSKQACRRTVRFALAGEMYSLAPHECLFVFSG